jgi:hypothetical protein
MGGIVAIHVCPPDGRASTESVDSMRAFLSSEGSFQINKSLDTHVLAQIEPDSLTG